MKGDPRSARCSVAHLRPAAKLQARIAQAGSEAALRQRLVRVQLQGAPLVRPPHLRSRDTATSVSRCPETASLLVRPPHLRSRDALSVSAAVQRSSLSHSAHLVLKQSTTYCLLDTRDADALACRRSKSVTRTSIEAKGHSLLCIESSGNNLPSTKTVKKPVRMHRRADSAHILRGGAAVYA